ncbi:MAG: polyprenyl synthetase family protein [Phycisphaerales bacterium]
MPEPVLAYPSDLLPVQEAVASALTRVEKLFDASLRSDLPPVQRLVQHIESYRGKMLRPALVVLCGMAAPIDPGGSGGSADQPREVSDAHIRIAAVCEMIHMATLVHDDVLDEADIRRKGATVNRLRGNEAAVILGDYLFSSAYHLCATLDSLVAARLIGQTGMTLCSGELLQLHHRENLSIDQPTYFEVVRRKTGSLISVACRLGAWQSGATETVANRFGDFGMALGVAFQIQDDLLDLTGNQKIVGKPLRKDLELGKLTLPVIHHLESASGTERARTLELLEATSGLDTGAVERLVAALERTRSLDFARQKARDLVGQAKSLLAPLTETPAKRLLLIMADQVVDRAN